MESRKVEQTTVNEGRTGVGIDTRLTQPRSGPVRYRFTDAKGKPYAPFRPKPGVTLPQLIEKAFPGEADDDAGWSLERA